MTEWLAAFSYILFVVVRCRLFNIQLNILLLLFLILRTLEEYTQFSVQ